MNLLLQVYKNYIQPRLDYGITLYGCNTQKNIDLVQRVQISLKFPIIMRQGW